MTSTQPGVPPVDVDTLADYLEGILSAEDASAVEALTTSDSAWSSTLAALRAAQPRVASALAGAAASAPAMPPDVEIRMDELVRSLGRPTNVVSLAEHKRGRMATAIRSRGFQAAAAGIVVLAGLGFAVQHASSDEKSSSGTSAVADGSAPRAPSNLNARPALAVTATGRDYTATTLHAAGTASQPFPTDPGSSRGPAGIVNEGLGGIRAGSVPAELQRLLDPGAFDSCLAAIEDTVGSTVTNVDFASYQRQPALIVRLASVSTVIVAGPTCGEPGAGADILGRA